MCFEMNRVLKKIVFVFPARMTAGGMPDDARQFIAAVSKTHDGDVVLLSQGTPDDGAGQLDSVSLVDLNVPGATEHVFDTLTPEDITVFITFSSLINVRLAKALRARGLCYTVLPAWQVHDFLDWDRPFARNAVPTIQASEKNAKQFNSGGAGGVVEGRATFRGLLRSIKRKLFRRTLGRTFLQNAAAIHVFSAFERQKIMTLVAPKEPNFLEVTFGTDIEGRRIGDDQFPDDGRKNIVFWGRADYYYKGLDTILDAIAVAKHRGISAPFSFWICGPDYNNGYGKLRAHIEQLQIADHARILGPGDYTTGTIGLLKYADFSILASRWDGYARTLRESGALGVAFICNRQSHFDWTIATFGNGLLFDDIDGMATILANLDSPEATEVQLNAKSKAAEFVSYISWSGCASRFVASLVDLEPAR
jgi:glycosyltransferase involved in cell wall biosynthesis